VGRSQRTLEDQKQCIRLALRSAVWEDAYRVVGRDTPQEREVSLILPGHGEPLPIQKARPTTAEYTAAVHAIVDTLPRHLLLHLPAAVGGLPVTERILLKLVVKEQRPYTAVAQALGWKRPGRVRDGVESTLNLLAGWLWDDHGHATLPPERE